MTKYAMCIDPNKCIGCNACRVACQMQWSLSPSVYFNRLEEHVEGEYPKLSSIFVPVQCQHCDKPPCEKVCPTKATYKREDGVVLIDADKCIKCKYCMAACPYNARVINEQGMPQKCSFCAEYVAKGEKPACVSTCMCGVRIFGDIDDPGSEISKYLASHKTVNIQGTSMYYVLPVKMESSVLPQACVSPLHVNVLKDVAQPVSKGILGLAAAAIVGAAVLNTVKGEDKNHE